MAMTLRLSEEQSDALRQQAEEQGVSMQSIALRAVDDYLARNDRRARIEAVLATELGRYADALQRLGQ